MMPSFFIAHGAPSIVIERNDYTQFLSELAASLPQKPKAIVLFSAHWEHLTQQVSVNPAYETIYDFSGFPDELYQIQYPAQGDASTAAEVISLFEANGIPVQPDVLRGLDHGAWAVLRLVYPDAEIPVVALSVNRYLSNEEQYRIGAALKSLKEQGILIIGSGGTVHNLRKLQWGAEHVNEWALGFDQWLEEKLTAWDTEALFHYETEAPYAKEAVPTPEHFIPLLLAMGSGDEKRKATLLHRSYQYGNLSLSSWKFD